MPGTLFVVATPIGNLEDITARALRILREATVIAAEDTRRTAHLLARYAIATPTTSLHEHNEHQKASSLVARLERGDTVALVSDAGTPTISDPGQRLIREAISVGIRVESVPGPNAAISALAVSGFAWDSFCFMGFPPTQSKERTAWFERARAVGGTIVFYEAPHRIRATLEQFRDIAGECETVICRELTKAHESVLRGPISEVIEKLVVKGEFTVVVNIGQSTDSRPAQPPGDADLRQEFGEITETSGLPRRTVIGRMAKKYHLSSNEVYAAIERAKKLV